MADYFLAPALVKLRDEVNAKFPKRDKTSDGWIGDASHSARPSDHNPCWTCDGRNRGVVRALDIDVDDNDPKRDLRRMILNETVGDPRVWYVISNGIIYSRTYGWEARRYTGSNPHYSHVHVSLASGNEFDTGTWFGDRKPRKVKPKPVSLSTTRKMFKMGLEGKPTPFRNGVGRIQQVMNRQYGANLQVDGKVGPATLKAWRQYERKFGGKGRPAIPDDQSIIAFSRGRFRVIP